VKPYDKIDDLRALTPSILTAHDERVWNRCAQETREPAKPAKPSPFAEIFAEFDSPLDKSKEPK
jgi:hypothetical protein